MTPPFGPRASGTLRDLWKGTDVASHLVFFGRREQANQFVGTRVYPRRRAAIWVWC
jgi:hypothetical protein